MAKKDNPIIIQYWRTGLYTRRSQLYTPIRSVGLNIMSMHDALIDGLNMEVTDLMELQRRPGFSRFCSVALQAGEIINEFYSFRTATGAVLPLFDSNQRLATFTKTSITTLWTKPRTDQAFPLVIGSQMYIANGSVSSPVNLIPDSDGNQGTWTTLAALPFSPTGGAVRGGKWTYTGTGSPSNFNFVASQTIAVIPGQTYTLSGYIDATNISAPGVGQGLPIWGVEDPSISTGYLGVSQSVGANGRVAGTFVVQGGVTQIKIIPDTGNITVTAGQSLTFSNPQLELGSSATPYQTGSFIGAARYDTKTATIHALGIPAPTTRLTVVPPTAAGSTFWQPGINYSTTLVVLLDPNGNIQMSSGLFGSLTTGSTPPTWNINLGGRTAQASGFWVNVGPPTTWQPNTTYTPQLAGLGQFIIDGNGNAQELLFGGVSGASQPTWSNTPGVTTIDNTCQWVCRGNATPGVFVGYQYVYVYSTVAPTNSTDYYHCSTASPVSYSTGVVFGSYNQVLHGAYSTSLDVGSVDIYRTADGGAIFNYVGSVANNTAGGTWSFTDNLADSALDNSTIVPLGGTHLNDPPPGTPGSITPDGDRFSYMAYWQGRIWAIAGNKVYFDAGGDCVNGDPHASWPPANVFQFQGPPIALAPTSAGLLVFMADSMKMIAGGPDTLSFFAMDLMDRFGISSPNAISRDGEQIRVLTTQGQLFEMDTANKTEEGNPIGDQLLTFPPGSSYLTTHRAGPEAAVYIGNGTDTIFRYSLNIGSWSTASKPVGGLKAFRSIETGVGVYTLCAGRATAGGFILARDSSTFLDDGQAYTCFITAGNWTLSAPGMPLVPVHYLAGYFAAVGSIPTVSILPNEITASTGIGFITLPNPQNEPQNGFGTNSASTTLMSKIWNVRNQQTMKTSMLMHHLQVKISFPAENQPNTIKALTLTGNEEA